MNRKEKVHSAVGQFIRLDRLHRRAIERQVGEMGLHRSGHRLLMYLNRHQKTPSQAELARFLEISPPAVTGTLKRLEAEGYIRRECSKEDNRNNVIQITDKGRDVLKDTRSRFNAVDGAMLQDLSDEDIALFCTLTEKMYNNLKTYEEGGENK